MPSIRILSDRVANQIAAGEVIERPVAVVKELVENSIDAGATRIEVEFRNGGKSYIRIEDNGKGMSPDEALLCLERHATSKIREAADLNEVCSFGFRGEALPSIASVSKFTLRTRTKEWEYGTEILINGGKMIEKKDCGMPVGTVIEVAHLFNSVPARRKFLKTDPTETAHITYNCRMFAVAHPNVAFRVLENGRTVFQSPACENLRDRIAEIWGRSLANDLIPVDVTDPKTGFRLTGLTAKPGVGRSTRRELVTLVNRRPVDSRTLSLAVLDAYHGRIQKGRYPPAFLFLEIKPQEVDVNVHPAKREVRFRDDGAIRRFVLNAVTETLAASCADDIAQAVTPIAEPTPTQSADTVHTAKPTPAKSADTVRTAKPIPTKSADTIRTAESTHTKSANTVPTAKPTPAKSADTARTAKPTPAAQPTPAAKPLPATKAAANKKPKVAVQPTPHTPIRPTANQAAPAVATRGAAQAVSTAPKASPQPALPPKVSNLKSPNPGWRLITLLKKRYALFDTARGLVMLHLRHADQRVRFERISKEFENEAPPSQRLLIPHPIEFEPLAAEALKSQLKQLNAQGFQVEEFGRNFYRIEAVPTWLSPEQAESFIRDLVDLVRQRGGMRKPSALDSEAIARLAVEGSYRRSDTLTEQAVEQLAKDLLTCDTPHTSPFGKPTFSEVSWNEWERRFGND